MAVKTVEQRLTVVEHKMAENANRIDGLRDAIAELGNRMDRRFLWLTGTLVATMLAVVSVLSAALLGG